MRSQRLEAGLKQQCPLSRALLEAFGATASEAFIALAATEGLTSSSKLSSWPSSLLSPCQISISG
jgi:hypothetical protein